MKITTKKIDKSQVEITGSIAFEEFEKYEPKALENISSRLELPGFRKGKVPTNMVKENVTDMMILEEMAEVALHNIYPKILEDEKIDAIDRPQVSITKIARGSDLEFKVITAVLPEVELPNYKKLAKDNNSKEEFKKEIIVDEKDVEKVINDLRKMRAEQKNKENHEGHEGMTEEEHSKAHAEVKEIRESDWPAFDDEFAKSFGDFKDAQALKDKIISNMKIEKETEKKDKLRLAIVEDLIKETKGDIPDILVESEIGKMLYRLEADITNMGFKFDEYLKQINKTEEDLKKEWRDDAFKRAKLQVIIHSISEKENLKPSEEEIENEITKIMELYKDADPIRARAYIEQMLENEKVFNFLENS